MSQAETHEAEPEGHPLSPASRLTDVTETEREVVEANSRPNAALIHETIRAEGEGELERSVSALLLSGLAAGLAMGFSLMTEGLLRAHLPDAPWRDLVSKLGYSVGFVVVVLGLVGDCASAAVASIVDPTNTVIMDFAIMCALPSAKLCGENERARRMFPRWRHDDAATCETLGCESANHNTGTNS